MPSYAEQLHAARAAHLAAISLETQVRSQIGQTYADWDDGKLDAQTVRHRLEAIVRAGYRSSIAVANEHAMQQAAVPKWRPTKPFNTPYLQSLLGDVRSNLRDYKASKRTDDDRRRAVTRMQHSAGVAAQRGYTDSTITAYDAMQTKFGFEVRKFWIANFENNTPCKFCEALHGTEVGLHETFHTQDGSKVYVNLQGPPRHPRCQCYIAVLIKALDNVDEPIDLDPKQPTPGSQYMTADDVKSMSLDTFNLVVASMMKVHEHLATT